MKKVYIAFIALLLSAPALLAQVRLGPFLAYGDKSGLWGLGVYPEFVVNEKLSVSPVFTQYFPKRLDNAPRRSMWEINANANYYFVQGRVGFFYGLAGLNFTRSTLKNSPSTLEDNKSDENVGVNVGLGTMARINDLLLPFAEAKFTAGGYSQFSVKFGLKFELGDRDLEDDY
ncbi:MAG TPA: hypothetical protein VFI14_08325 [Chryseosolibacter sp.]|nr:hypothetical protein [Chryseosolibacter sp.]